MSRARRHSHFIRAIGSAHGPKAMIHGTITMSGVTDQGMILTVEAMKQQPLLSMTQVQPQLIAGLGSPPTQIFYNLVLAWNTHEGRQALSELLPKLVALGP